MGLTIGAAQDRGRGLGREAMRLGLTYCWDGLALERVTLRVYGDNPAAIRCYGHAGFAVEGIMRGAAFLAGRRVDVTIMGALRNH
jgi:RimJ/RimL family protein N-acetyltransferase